MKPSPQKRDHKSFFVFFLPVLLIAVIGVMTWGVVATQNALVASPFLLVAAWIWKGIQWTMLWQCTPNEKELLGKNMEQAGSVNKLLNLFRKKDKDEP